MDIPFNYSVSGRRCETDPIVVPCGPRKSGLTRLQLALMGKGVVKSFRLRGRAEEQVDYRALMQPGHGR